MKIGVLSDTHGCMEGWQRALASFATADCIIHAGDLLYHGPRNPLPPGYAPGKVAEAVAALSVPFYWVRGNCDAEVDGMVTGLEPPEFFVADLGLRLLVNHGHRLSEQELVDRARAEQATLVVTGHTHIPLLRLVEGIVFLNPGSPSLPKGDSRPTAALVTSRAAEIKELVHGKIIARHEF